MYVCGWLVCVHGFIYSTSLNLYSPIYFCNFRLVGVLFLFVEIHSVSKSAITMELSLVSLTLSCAMRILLFHVSFVAETKMKHKNIRVQSLKREHYIMCVCVCGRK